MITLYYRIKKLTVHEIIYKHVNLYFNAQNYFLHKRTPEYTPQRNATKG